MDGSNQKRITYAEKGLAHDAKDKTINVRFQRHMYMYMYNVFTSAMMGCLGDGWHGPSFGKSHLHVHLYNLKIIMMYSL